MIKKTKEISKKKTTATSTQRPVTKTKKTPEKISVSLNKLGKEIEVRKQEQKALQKSNLLFNLNPASMVLSSLPERKFIEVNDAFLKTFGFSREEVLGKTSKELKIFVNQEKHLEAAKQLKSHGRIANCELKARCKNGTILDGLFLGEIIESQGKKYFLTIMIDLTSHKGSEKAQRESEGKYRTLLESTEESYYEIDLAGNLTFFNDSLCQLLGYSRKELMSMNNRRYTDKETANKVFQAFNKVYKTGESTKEFDWQIIRKDGTKRYIEQSVSLQKDSSGKPTGFRGIIRDITERKQVEEKLRQEELRFRSLAEQSSDIIVLVNREGIITYENQAVEKNLGLKVESQIGTSIFERTHPDDLKLVTDAFKAFFSDINAPPQRNEVRMLHGDGSWHTFEVVASNLIHNNTADVVIGNLRDITERKKMEEKFLHEEKRFRSLAEQSSDIIVLVNKEGIITYENPAIEKALGFKPEERIGTGRFDHIHPDDVKTVIDAFNTLVKDTNAPVLQSEVRIRHRDGSWRTFEAVASNLVHDNVIEYVMVNFRDITESKKALKLLKQSEAQYRLLADHMKDQVWIMDLNLKATYISPSVERLLGYTLDDLKELPLDKLLTSASFKEAMDFFSMEMPKALEAPLTYTLKRSLELGFRCKKGHTYWGECMFSFIRDKNGKPLSILGEGRDITERKRIENSLQESEENFRHSLDDSPLGVRVSTTEGETIYANRAVLGIYGYESIEELNKTPLRKRYTPESYAQFQIRKEERLRGEFGPSEYEISIVRKDGNVRHVHVFRKEIFWNTKKQFQLVYHDITERRLAEKKLNETLESLRKSIRTTIQVLGTASEARDPYTAGHQRRVADLARAIATEIGLPRDTIEGIRMAGAIHDIGKISIPSEILTKPAKLSDLEFSLIKVHTQYSYEIMKEVESPWPLAEIVQQHHERMNGSGYPQGLKGQEILIEARILAVADVVEAMSSYRPYRPALGIEIALTEIEENAGILYDSTVAAVCLKLFRENRFKLE